MLKRKNRETASAKGKTAMQNYDEKHFKAKANRRAGTTWLMLMFIVSLYYGVKMNEGVIAPAQFAVMSIVGWVEYLTGALLLKFKGMHYSKYKWVLGICYLTYFVFITWSSMDEISYVFILPLISILILYKDPKLIKVMMWATMAVLISVNLYKGRVLGMMEFVSSIDCALQFAIVLCCFACTNMAIKHLVESDGALTGSIEENLRRVVQTVEKVKVASNEVVDGVTVVRELADENRMGAENVVTDMRELSDNNGALNDSTMSSVEMTRVIDTQMTNVAELMDQVVTLIEASVEHANVSSNELAEVMNMTNKMAELSAEVETVLRDFKEEFQNVKKETGTIDSITSQTSLLAVNASIEAARAGEAGKGFAVVAREIRELSSGTQNSSNRIADALSHLEETYEKMLSAISETIGLIQANMEKMAYVDRSVTDITNDAATLGVNIKIVDSAVKEVETSNQTLADNMQQVCDLMESMTQRINRAELTTKEMLSKYEESAKSAVSIETVVGRLMEELGVGGFMGVQDVRAGMKIAVAPADNGAVKKEYKGEVVSRSDKTVFVTLEEAGETAIGRKNITCQLRIVVDNTLYSWDDVEMRPASHGEHGAYKLLVETNPRVLNRRKYPRMPLANECTVAVKGENRAYPARMVNISANGFAFAIRDPKFADMKGKDLLVEVRDFALLKGTPLEGCIIRATNNDGEYIVGCRMPRDIESIKEYVSNHYSE